MLLSYNSLLYQQQATCTKRNGKLPYQFTIPLVNRGALRQLSLIRQR